MLPLARVLEKLPRGIGLTDAAWRQLHRVFQILLWIHIPGVVAFGLFFDRSWTTCLIAASCLLPFGVAAGVDRLGRRARSVIVSLGLGTASGLLVHLSGGYIEFHFHYFVMVTLLMLYQDWMPFLITIGFVALQHGVLGVLHPHSVYNHEAAIAAPWPWAILHGVYIAAAAVGMIATWRKLEDRVDDARRDHERLKALYEELEKEVARRRQTELALAESHAELERRVEERTAALDRANQTLRAEAADRVKADVQLDKVNAELQERLQELERFHDMVVGRELKMMELERVNAALREQLTRSPAPTEPR